jgi:hypothetical protein
MIPTSFHVFGVHASCLIDELVFVVDFQMLKTYFLESPVGTTKAITKQGVYDMITA